MAAPKCPVHGTPLVMFCPACRGGRGGRAKTERKAVAARLNAARPRKRTRSGVK
jgi:hypothetical protein